MKAVQLGGILWIGILLFGISTIAATGLGIIIGIPLLLITLVILGIKYKCT